MDTKQGNHLTSNHAHKHKVVSFSHDQSLSFKRKLGKHGFDVVFSSMNNQIKALLESTKDPIDQMAGLSPGYTKVSAQIAEKYTSDNLKEPFLSTLFPSRVTHNL